MKISPPYPASNNEDIVQPPLGEAIVTDWPLRPARRPSYAHRPLRSHPVDHFHRRARCLRGGCGPSPESLSRCKRQLSIAQSKPTQGSPWPISARRAPCSSHLTFPPCGNSFASAEALSEQGSDPRSQPYRSVSPPIRSLHQPPLWLHSAPMSETWPRDALVLSLAANQGGLIGMSGLAGRVDVLFSPSGPPLAPHYGNDWWFQGHYGMALSEIGRHEAARPMTRTLLGAGPVQRLCCPCFRPSVL